ncbi:hypothetical protein D3C80_1755670 [compost metagenome]
MAWVSPESSAACQRLLPAGRGSSVSPWCAMPEMGGTRARIAVMMKVITRVDQK